MSTDLTPSDQKAALSDAATTLTAINRKIAKLYVEAALCCDDLAGFPPDQVRTFLSTHANMSFSEVEQLQKTAAALSPRTSPFSIHRELLINSGISIAAINKFANATEVAQHDTIRLLNKEKVLRADEVHKVRDADREWERLEASRKAALKAFSTQVTERKIDGLERQAETISVNLRQFDESWFNGEFDEDEELHAFCRKELIAGAAKALGIFEDLFGSAHALLKSPSGDAPWLAASYFALRQLADGKFGVHGGLGLHCDVGVGRLSLQEALSPLISYDEFSLGPGAPLKVLELCAGAGGMSIGLQAAGFEHAGLFDRNKPAVETLRHNQPHWPVTQFDVRKLGEKQLARFRHVDLLAAGLPCLPGAQLDRRPNLYPKMIDVIRLIRPKAFILECDAGAREKYPRPLDRADIVNAMIGSDYVVTEFSLDTKEFGLPHSTSRDFFVGIHKDVPRLFEQPRIMTRSVEEIARKRLKNPEWKPEPPGHVKGTGQVLAPVIAPFTTKTESSVQQNFYNSWEMHWRSHFGMSMLPDIPSKQTTDAEEQKKKRLRRAKHGTEEDAAGSWELAGFLGPRVVEDPPSVDEVTDYDFKPRITFAALAAAQGFPKNWQFKAEGENDRLTMIQAALPPVMARMVGLAVRSALTGEVFNLDHEVKVPVIEDSKVGPQPVVEPRLFKLGGLRRSVVRHVRLAPVALLPRDDLYQKAARVLRGEYLNEVERNHKRRADVRKTMVLVQEEWGRLEEFERARRKLEDLDAWEAYPHPEEAAG
ncbi:hypothetical protein ELH22_08710 [Rhizobium ruizarguesonis]|uniref:DNA cytosine methyltransferase n=1 Tax=Rhizobium ruizarguesonis TaxID=2081791 RepID=UPI00102F8A4E|nr:DNA cytosine methyltransferase [Rhizobium ruizarguesonis]TBD63411.1 hypothetical protein ELH22_08710 [Rhizobium ruizarguesonis]